MADARLSRNRGSHRCLDRPDATIQYSAWSLFTLAAILPPPIVDARTPVLASVVLQRLHDEVPPGHFTLGWLMDSLQKRSFGIIMLLLALVAIAPGISIAAGILLMIPAFQMIADKPAPAFPRRIANHGLPTKRLADLVQRCLPGLRYLETAIRPRWHTLLGPTKRIVGVVVVLLSATLVVSPIPFSNVVPALVVALISIAYLEEDGISLSIALLTALVVLAAATMAVRWSLARNGSSAYGELSKIPC
jgi:hypothetical protein